MAGNSNNTLGSWRSRGMLCVFLFIAAGIAVISATGVGEREHSARSGWHVTGQPGKISPWVIRQTANGQKAEFFVVLADQADLRRASDFATKPEKGRYVYDALRNKSQATQEPILQWLRDARYRASLLLHRERNFCERQP